MRALDRCVERIAAKTAAKGGRFDVRNYQWTLFHQPYHKLVQKAYARLLWNQHKLTGDVDGSLNRFKSMAEAESYVSRDLEKVLAGVRRRDAAPLSDACLRSQASLALSSGVYDKCVLPGTMLSREMGNIYTGSLYLGLASLLGQFGQSLAGQVRRRRVSLVRSDH